MCDREDGSVHLVFDQRRADSMIEAPDIETWVVFDDECFEREVVVTDAKRGRVSIGRRTGSVPDEAQIRGLLERYLNVEAGRLSMDNLLEATWMQNRDDEEVNEQRSKKILTVIFLAIVTLGLLVAVASCASSPAPAVASAPLPHQLLKFERGPCFGDCPSYKVVLFDDGLVRFGETLEGSEPAEARLTPAAVAKVRSLLERVATLTPDCCACVGPTDMPDATMTFALTADAAPKRVNHYHGCERAPDWLYDVENSIDELLGTERWIGQKMNVRPYHPKR
jgi:hypothetical protein